MPTAHTSKPIASPEPPPPACELTLATFTYEERRVVLPALSEALALCGGWLLDRRPLSMTQMEFVFDLELRSVVELYAALIAAGLELTRDSHLELTGLCMLRKHRHQAGRGARTASVVTVRMEVTFLEEVTLPAVLSTGTAFA